jgi:hypothetical protein
VLAFVPISGHFATPREFGSGLQLLAGAHYGVEGCNDFIAREFNIQTGKNSQTFFDIQHYLLFFISGIADLFKLHVLAGAWPA